MGMVENMWLECWLALYVSLVGGIFEKSAKHWQLWGVWQACELLWQYRCSFLCWLTLGSLVMEALEYLWLGWCLAR